MAADQTPPKTPRTIEPKLIPQDVEDRARDDITVDATDFTDEEMERAYGQSMDEIVKRADNP